MKFEETKLLDHPEIRKAFNACAAMEDLCQKDYDLVTKSDVKDRHLPTFSRPPKEFSASMAEAREAAEVLSVYLEKKDPYLIASALTLEPLLELNTNFTLDKFLILKDMDPKTVAHLKNAFESRTLEDNGVVNDQNRTLLAFELAANIVDLTKDPSAASFLTIADEAPLHAIDPGLARTMIALKNGRKPTP